MVQSGNQSRLAAAGLGRVAPDIQALARESIRLMPHGLDSSSIPPGISRLGGQPELPAQQTWPVWKNIPMSFVAQVRLEQLAPFPPARVLPPNGMLSFFYDANQETYGADPDDRGGWQVLYLAGDPASRLPRPFPADLPAEARFTPAAWVPSIEMTLPVAPAQVQPDLHWSEDEIHHYEQLLSTYPTPDDRRKSHHRMFGYPDQIQDDMQLGSALAAHGYRSPDDPGAATAAARKAEWQLLLQVDSAEDLGMRWASVGMLYFWIEQSALQAQRFDQTWVILQSD